MLNYLQKIEELLSYAKSPQKKEILEEVWKVAFFVISVTIKLSPTKEEIRQYCIKSWYFGFLLSMVFGSQAITITIRNMVDHNMYWLIKFRSLGKFGSETIENEHAFHYKLLQHHSQKFGSRKSEG